MIINHNLGAMNAQRQMSTNQNNMSNSMEKLSSGLRINRAGDDAAGLAISEKMRGQIRGLEQAERNSQDGISMIQTAEGALNETHDILQRMRELAVQASNDTNTGSDRNEIQKEIDSLTSEVNRIGNTTEFNTQKLLDGGGDKVTNISSSEVSGTSELTVDGVTITADGNGGDYNDYELSVTDGGSEGIAIDHDNKTIAITADITNSSTTDLSTLTPTVTGNDPEGVSAAGFTFSGTATSLTTGSSGSTSGGDVSIESTSFTIDKPLEAGESIEVAGETINIYETDQELADASDNFGISLESAATAEAQATAIAGMSADFTDHDVISSGGTVTITQSTAGTGDTSEASFNTNGFDADFQIGANNEQSLSLKISDMRSEALGISSKNTGEGFADSQNVTNGTDSEDVEYSLSVATHEDASEAVETIQNAIDKVSAERSQLGANQNRLEHTINNLGTSAENLQSAESRIRDVDMAKEMMNMTKNNILSQASQSMLAQANQQPQSVLQLLG